MGAALLDRIKVELRAQRDECDAALRALEALEPKRKKRRKNITEAEVRDAVLSFGQQEFGLSEVARKLNAHPASSSIARALRTFAAREMIASVRRGRWKYVPPPKFTQHRAHPVTRSFVAAAAVPGTGRKPRTGRHATDEKLRRLAPSAIERRHDGRVKAPRPT